MKRREFCVYIYINVEASVEGNIKIPREVGK